MEKFLVDVPVLLLFFKRPEQTAKVFEQIKKARPSKLYLYQDGPRENRDDMKGIFACRKIVEDVDWECEIHKHYCEKNQGCDPSEYLSQKWLFENEEYGIILEDDDVPAESFFRYCKELLEKYKNDDRIHMICGYNVIDEYSNSEADYFFAKVCSIWGWATWKRVVDEWNSIQMYDILDDENALRMYVDNFPSKKERKSLTKMLKNHRDSGIEYYETINSISMMSNNRLAIIPSKNMISNIGIAAESTHSVSDIKYLPKRTRKLLNKKINEIEFPIKHPKYIFCDNKYRDLVDKAYGNSGLMAKIEIIERIYRKILRIINSKK